MFQCQQGVSRKSPHTAMRRGAFRANAESSKQLGILPRIAVRGDSRVGARNDGMRDTPLIEHTTWQLADIHIKQTDANDNVRRKILRLYMRTPHCLIPMLAWPGLAYKDLSAAMARPMRGGLEINIFKLKRTGEAVRRNTLTVSTLQHGSFCRAKQAILQRKTTLFALQYGPFRKPFRQVC